MTTATPNKQRVPQLEDNSSILGGEYLTLESVLKVFGRHPRTWARLEARGEGPPRTLVGKLVIYRRDAFIEWLRAREERTPGRVSANGRLRKPVARAASNVSAPSNARTRNARRAGRAA